jgi:hypothetical protein
MKAGKWLMDEKNKTYPSIVLEDGHFKKDCQLNALGVKNLILKTSKEKSIKNM